MVVRQARKEGMKERKVCGPVAMSTVSSAQERRGYIVDAPITIKETYSFAVSRNSSGVSWQ